MFKKTIEFEDFNGDKRTQDFYFHLSKGEIAAMGAGANAYMNRIKRIAENKDGLAIIEEFRAIIKMACGARSDDGSRFIKTPETQSALLDSPAFDELLMELFVDAEAGAQFMDQLFPKKMIKELIEQAEKQQRNSQVPSNAPNDVLSEEDTRPEWIRENRAPTQQELMAATPEQIQLAFRRSGK
jgi:hypothetical protein